MPAEHLAEGRMMQGRWPKKVGVDTVDLAAADYCCLDDCCGPGSWCCQRANPHTHTSDDRVVPASRTFRPKGDA
jgi:hypothetical protein